MKIANVRLSFPDLYVPMEFKKGDGKPRYNASFLYEAGSDTDKAITAEIQRLVVEKFGPKATAKLAAFKASGDYCIADGNAKDYDGYDGMLVLSSHRGAEKGPVGVYGNVIDPSTGSLVKLTAESGKPYAGCYVNATVSLYTSAKFPGIWCGLEAVQFWRDGDAFAGGKPPSPDDFEPIADGADAEAMA